VKKLFFLLIGLALYSCAEKNNFPLSVEYTDDGLWIYEYQEPVLFYNALPKSLDGEYSRSNYIHPLYDLNGALVTEDFPKDHLHHRGIFWTWHQTWIGDKRIGDAWLCEDFSWNVVEAKAYPDSDRAVIKTRVFWESPLWVDDAGQSLPFVEEQAKVTVHLADPNYRCIDFEISLRALEPELRIGGSEDAKGYSGFSPRVVLSDDIQFTDENGFVEPKTIAVTAGPWVDLIRTVEDNMSGMTIMQHPDNPNYVQDWILRAKRSMQNPLYPGAEPVLISTQEPTVLKYRLVLHTGEADLAKIFKAYTETN